MFGGDEAAAPGIVEPAGAIYSDADRMLGSGSYEAAAKRFEDVDRDHPYAAEARRALVMAAYSYFRAELYDEAISSAKRYTTLHPGTSDAALAHHIIASSYFRQINDPARDQSKTKLALEELQTLVRRYPDSKYAEEAQNRIRITQDVLAASEMNVGRFYLKKQQYEGAISRFRTVVTDYQTTAHVEEALYRLTEAYLALGIVNEAQTAAAVLGHNFPESKWYRDAYALLGNEGYQPNESSGSWISRAWSSTIAAINPF